MRKQRRFTTREPILWRKIKELIQNAGMELLASLRCLHYGAAEGRQRQTYLCSKRKWEGSIVIVQQSKMRTVAQNRVKHDFVYIAKAGMHFDCNCKDAEQR